MDTSSNDIKTVEIVMLGSCIGKTTLLSAFMGKPRSTGGPTLLGYERKTLAWNGFQVVIKARDTSFSGSLHNVRKLACYGVDVAMLCYSTVDNDSLEEGYSLYAEDYREAVPDGKIVLIGTKRDLKASEPGEVVSVKTAKRMCKRLKAYGMLECSGADYYDDEKNNFSNVEEAFLLAIEAALEHTLSGKSRAQACIIL